MRILFLFLLLLISCTHVHNSDKSISRNLPQEVYFQKLLSDYWEDHLKLFPLEATIQGDNRYNNLLPNDQTEDFRKKLDLFYRDQLSKLSKINRNDLNYNDQISYDIFKYEMNLQIEGNSLDDWMIPFQQFEGLPLTMAQIGSGESFQPFTTVQDYLNWVERVDAFTHWVDSSIDNMKIGIKSNIVLPKSLVKKMITQMKELAVSDPTKSIFYQPIKNIPSNFSEVDKTKLTNLYVEMINSKINPSYNKLYQFLKNDYLPHSRKTSGLSSLKGGRKIYNYLVKSWTTTKLDPMLIYNIGLNEVARILKEMKKVQKQVGFNGSLKQFFDFMKNDPQFMPYKKPEEIINAFNNILNTIKPNLKTMFNLKPKSPFEIKQTEAFRAATASAEYQQGSADGSRPGIFYIPIIDATKFNITSGMESLFLHEAIPGHHYQISIQQENGLLPEFRKFAWYGAYGEGWALYTESLGKDLGLYTNPYQYMGALGDEMHRAVRLVVDVAIHLKGMSREKAIKYMLDHEAITREYATSEVERYMAIPAQALSYKIGSLKILELRNKYQKLLDNKFNIANFHDEFLKDGCMPLEVLENKMNNWAEKYNK